MPRHGPVPRPVRVSHVARAVVLIGVARTGGRFPELPAVPGAVAVVREWARAQGVPDDLVRTFADTDGGSVTVGDVLGGVRALVDRGDVDQLVVYFSGHGINTGNAEFWLLPGAPEDGSQAVNVSLTSWYAERLPVRHVVLVSDACRTAASTVQELSIQGAAVVPNLPPRGAAAAVDVFYACALGDPAYEVKDPATSGAAYQALFTTVLVAALRGDHPALVTGGDGAGGDGVVGGGTGGAGGPGGTAFGLVQPWPLKRALPGLVAERLTALHAPLDLSQTPDARLSSDPAVAWLSRLEPWPAPGAATEAYLPDTPDAGARPDRTTLPDQPTLPVLPTLPAAAEAADRLAVSLAVGAAAPAAPVTAGPGLEVATVAAPAVVVHGDRVVAVEQVTSGAAVVTLASGGCAVLPTVPGRVTLATVEDGSLVDCSLPRDPSARSDGSRDGPGPSGGTGPVARRALAAAWSRFGLSRDDEDDPDDPDVDADPLAAVYRVWEHHDRGRRDAVTALARPGAPGADLFDVLLLAGGAAPDGAGPRWGTVLTPVPLLARGWALLAAAPAPVRARALAFPPRRPSHWTLFAAADAPRVVAAVADAARPADRAEESP